MRSTYVARWGHKRTPKPLTHPKRQARRERALARQAEEAKRLMNDTRRKKVRLAAQSAH